MNQSIRFCGCIHLELQLSSFKLQQGTLTSICDIFLEKIGVRKLKQLFHLHSFLFLFSCCYIHGLHRAGSVLTNMIWSCVISRWELLIHNSI